MSPEIAPNAGLRRRPTPDESLRMLLEGNERYLSPDHTPVDYSATRIAATTHEPIAAILGCGDARVGAELIFDRGPGDLFMVRVAGNFLSDYGLASMEFAVEFLNVPLLMVLGHTHCGAVTSAVRVVEEGIDLPGRLPVLIDAIEPSVLQVRMNKPDCTPDELLIGAIEANVRRQVRRLSTISPIISTAREAGTVRIVGAVFELETGAVRLLDG